MKIKCKNKLKIVIILIMIISNIFISFSFQSLANIQIADNNQGETSQNLSIYSGAAILIDSKTGKVLYEKNSNEKKYPASTTKILTAIINNVYFNNSTVLSFKFFLNLLKPSIIISLIFK